ncbi:RlpA-like double-psi beta-barrel-protein domain-containing protein-containing protein [Podospora conica]|nr:RlpA-like double-psi beta-barrel-protein domain-containing protein-containing protein [Schizothecium conicum]
MLGSRLLSGSLATVAGLASLANADFIQGSAMLTGQVTTGGTCSFANYTLPRDIYGVGIGGGNWAGGGKCGSCLDVYGPGGSARVMIVDSCTSCANNRLNLFSDAFRRIAGTDKGGIIDVEFDVVSCEINDPIVVRNKIGTSRYHFSLQVLNANLPITALHVSTDKGQTWEETVRREYNFFERAEGKNGGFSADKVMVRVSCSNGRRVILPEVSAAELVVTRAPTNC